jgi:hypothetical protein
MAVPELADWLRGFADGRATWGGPWVEIGSGSGVWVPPLPARLDGIFWGVTAGDAQRIADELGARLMTPLLVDLVRSAAAVRLNFQADPSNGTDDMMGEAAMFRYSSEIARRLAAAGVDLRYEAAPLCCVGAKDWVLTRDLELGRSVTTGKPLLPSPAVNYGAFVARRYEPSVSGRFRVIQSPGYAHNTAHRDYSQLLRLCLAPGVVVPAHDGATIERLPSVPRRQLAAGAPEGAAAGLGILALALLG